MNRAPQMDRNEHGAATPPGVARRPPADVVAFMVHLERSMMGWKQTTPYLLPPELPCRVQRARPRSG
jgi:hypothetical protein